jgi:hypothetical protein
VARQESAMSRLWPQATVGFGAPEALSAVRSVDQKPAYGELDYTPTEDVVRETVPWHKDQALWDKSPLGECRKIAGVCSD